MKRVRDLSQDYGEQAAKRFKYHLEKFGEYKNDDFCKICCNDKGTLICCDGCPAAFHLQCTGLHSVPEKFFCKYCLCASCNERGTLITCRQCDVRLHRSCSSDGAFCSSKCRALNTRVEQLIGRANQLDDCLSWSILNGRSNPSTLKEALRVLNDGFKPVVNQVENVDYLPAMVHNVPYYIKCFDFSKFLVVVLEKKWTKKSTIVCVALLRIHGTSLAELPFITTRRNHEGKGYCKMLMSIIEKMLVAFNIKQITLLAAEDIEGMWRKKFGFSSPSGKCPFNLIELEGAGFLEKKLMS